jgi:SAM-dependent methyltransferase
MYLRMASRRLDEGEREYRRSLLDGLSGQVIEVGAGSGINFAFYPRTVAHVLAIEPEPVLRYAAVENADRAPVPVTVVSGVSGALPAEDRTCDGAVASLVLCSVPDPGRALTELHRVLRPGGELRFYEHVVSRGRRASTLQKLADLTFWPRIAGGCHMSRDTGAEIERAGFAVESCERFAFSPGAPVPPLAHILGRARRP